MKGKKDKNCNSKLKGKVEKIYKASPDVIIITRFKNGKIVDVSNAFEEITGYTTEEFIGRSSIELYVNPEDRSRLLSILKQNGKARNFEFPLKTKSGEIVNILLNSELIEMDGELYIVSVARDITELKRAQEEHKRALEELKFVNKILEECTRTLILEDVLHNILECIMKTTGFEGAAVCLLNEDNTLTLSAQVGLSEEKAEDLITEKIKVGESICGKSAEDGKPQILRNREEVLSLAKGELKRAENINFHVSLPLFSRGKCQGVLCVFTRTGHTRPEERFLNLLERLCPYIATQIENAKLYKEKNEFLETLERTVAERTKELNEANAKLKEHDRLKSMFIASMSHELRTPLNSIIGFVGILLQRLAGELNEEQERQLKIVQKSAKHLLDLINDIIDISKIESGEVRVSLEEFDLTELVKEVCESIRLEVEKKNLKMIENIEEGIIIKTDRRRIKQILNNFVSNAVKFTDEGMVEVSLSKRDDKLSISVSDTGPGLTKEDLDKLFEPFNKILIKNRPPKEGTGLGLYISKKIANILGGDISVESEFGKGSKFTLTLPLKEA